VTNAIARSTPASAISRTVSSMNGREFLFPQYIGRSRPAARTLASSSRHWALIGLTPPTA